MSGTGIFGALAEGYTQAARERRQQNLALGEHQRDLQIGLLDKLLSDPSTPEEYKGTLLQQRIATTNANQYDKNGILKLPSLDDMRQQLPPVQRPSTPGPSAMPPVQLGVPQPPPGMGDTGPQSTQGPPSASLPASGIQKPAGSASVPPALPPPSPVTLPSTPLTMPSPPPIAEAGQFHPLSQGEQQQRQIDLAMSHAQQLIKLGASPTQAYIASGLIPKPQYEKLSPGESLINPAQGGAPIAQNTLPPKAVLDKPAYEAKMGPGGEFQGIIDNTGQRPRQLSPDEVAKNPDAKMVADQAQGAIRAREQRVEDKESRLLSRTLAIQTQAMINALQRGAVQDVQKAASEARQSYNKLNTQQQQDESRYQIMQQAFDDIQKHPENVGSFDAALAAFHMGMTVGQVKGMRTGKDMVEFHTHARSLPESMQVALEKWTNGAQLSDEQRQNFLELAREKMAETRQMVTQSRNQYDEAYGKYRDFIATTGKGKVQMPTQLPGMDQPKGPRIGDMEDGYRFNGGDAADQKNWTKVK